MSQVSGGKSEQVPRARLLLSRMLELCSDWFGVRWVHRSARVWPESIGRDRSDAPHGTPYFPFYRTRESMGYSGGKEKNERDEEFF